MALRSIKTRLCSTKRIPGILSGILFFFFPLLSGAAGTRLAEELYQEGSFSACARESLRILSQSPSNETAAFLNVSAKLHAGPADLNACLATLLPLARQASQPEIRAHAADESAWLLLKQNKTREAWELAEQAFLTTSNSSVFLSSGALLTHIITRHPEQARPTPSLSLQLQTCARVLAGARPPPFVIDSSDERHSLFSLPGQWIVSFYRHAIRPAIGTRCSLSPSCSEYFLQASRKHKLLAIPMIADRLVREPSVVNSGRATSRNNGKTIILDPLDNHDFWMTANP